MCQFGEQALWTWWEYYSWEFQMVRAGDVCNFLIDLFVKTHQSKHWKVILDQCKLKIPKNELASFNYLHYMWKNFPIHW
jgi:hypothetical protein